ncbi:MAG: hypothetical protein AB7O98_17840 [Hyphomonadaceae bacterium]
MRFIAVFAVFAAIVAVSSIDAPQAQAQARCETVEVSGARQPRVELYDLTLNPVGFASRDELSAITSGRACSQMADYLMIEVGGQRRLVRRTAMNVNSGAVELPPCSSAEYQSQAARNASSSGLGGAACRSD